MGCSQGPITLSLEDEFTDREVELIYSAIDEWVEATDSNDAAITITGRFSPSEPFVIQQWEDYEDSMFKAHESDPGYESLLLRQKADKLLGVANEISGNVVLIPDRIGADFAFRWLAMHEIGHLYGLHNETDGIMGRSLKGPGDDCIHEIDIKRFCDINHCGPNAHATCE
jgi:hypothetical protein